MLRYHLTKWRAVVCLGKESNYIGFDIGPNYRYTGKNQLVLPADQIYYPLLGRKISDLMFVLNFLMPGKSGEGMLPLHSIQDTRLHRNTIIRIYFKDESTKNYH